jgi:hypothetical protein
MISDNHFQMTIFAFITITLITFVFHVGYQKKIDSIMVLRQLSQEDEKINKVISLVQSKIKALYG